VTVTPEERLTWLAFNLVLAEWPALARAVLDRYPTPADAFAAPRIELRALGFDEDLAARFLSPALPERAQKEFDRLGKNGYSLLTFADIDYPISLKEVFDPPYVLYCAGRTEVLRGPAIAIVGTRRPSPYGRGVAERLAEDLASRGLTIVSGMARGIDAIAHEGALRGGRTIAVLGSGLMNIYPPENRRLFGRIAASGVVVTEFPPDAEPVGFHFPLRNRVISGLALGVVVVEAAEKSGSLITAGMALEQNREVMAVPGNVTSGLSRGAHWLIKKGAALVEGWEDVAEALPSPVREAVLAEGPGRTRLLPLLSEEEAAVLDRLAPDEAVSIDALMERSGRTVSELLALLLSLEIKGAVKAAPGKCYVRSL
jgi:DNA processing protein